MLGVDFPDGRWWYDTNYQGGHNIAGAWSIGTGYHFTDKLELIVGYTIFNAPFMKGRTGR